MKRILFCAYEPGDKLVPAYPANLGFQIWAFKVEDFALIHNKLTAMTPRGFFD